MTTRGIRTPRRRKAWSVINSETAIVAANSPNKLDLLGGISSGVSKDGSTVMRVIGTVAVVQLAQATSGVLSSGAAGVPEPLKAGERDIQWIHTGFVEGLEEETDFVAGTPLKVPTGTGARSVKDIDVTMQRKSPGQGALLAIVFDPRSGTWEDSKVSFRVMLSTMIALP